jgi:hypothetical protein
MNVTKRELGELLVGTVLATGLGGGIAGAQDNGTKRVTTSKQDLSFRDFRQSPAKNWDEQQLYQRGIEAVIWAMPAVSMAFFRDGAFEAYGMTYHDIMAFSHPAQPRQELLTSNAQVPYVIAMFDLRQGPVVMDIPPANDKSLLYGQVVDAWQACIADIGPSGADKGEGGKYLFTPPQWTGPVPLGYLHVPSESYRLNMMLRSVKKGAATDADAHAYSQRIRIYPLAKADNPPTQRFVDGIDKAWDSLPHYDMQYFTYIADLVTVEPARVRDKVIMGMLRTLGIEPGKPFKPDARATEILQQSVLAGRAQMEIFFENWGRAMSPYWPDRQWGFIALGTKEIAQFTYETDTTLYLDDRAGGMFYGATFLPKSLEGGGTFYLCGLRDATGELFKGPNTYRMRVPKDVPARDFWAIVAYDLESKSYIFNDLNRGGLSSYDKPSMKLNEDGSVDIYLAPRAPAGLEGNWIPTSGRDFFLFFRFYGPQKAIFDRSYKLPDVERVS